ncbi:MAG: hypothetical protein AB7N65_25295 [Vicinamibacterales bacterium]
MPFLRFARDKRGYEHTYLIHASSKKGAPARILYWYRTPPGVKVGRMAFDDEVRRSLETQHPSITFDWARLMETPVPSPDVEHWRERRRAEKAARQARQAAEREVVEVEEAPEQAEELDRLDQDLVTEVSGLEDEAGALGLIHDAVQPELNPGETGPAPLAPSEEPAERAARSLRRRRRRGGRRRRRPGTTDGPGTDVVADVGPDSVPFSDDDEGSPVGEG